MGFYLETPKSQNKAEQLVKMYGAKEVRMEDALDAIFENKRAVICVLRNQYFDAAAFCFDLDEFRRLNHVDDPRPRKWLIIDDRDMVDALTGYKAERERRESMQNKLMSLVEKSSQHRLNNKK